MKSEMIPPATGITETSPDAAARARLPRPVREQQMLDAASDLFGEQGYHAVSMDQIAHVVGISKPMLYAYFDSKEGLCTACLKRAGADAINAIGASYVPGTTPEQSLWSGFLAFFQFVRRAPSSWKLIRSQTSYDVGIFQEMVAEIHSDLRSVVQEIEKSASRETAADPFADDELRIAASWALFGAAFAMADRWLEEGCRTPAEDYATELMNFFWIGIRSMTVGESWKPLTEA
ncbi:MAG: TetR/AcrR family transcriptional regulator [Thermoleophilaceae bacterium]|nr:TetR/AcrR family transcriptional regulator [Thermoleophilaceae bacterium]